METKRRSLAKALSWRFIATAVTVTVAYLYSHDVKAAAAIGVADSLIKIFAYYLHERAWIRAAVPKAETTSPAVTAMPGGAKSC